MPGQVTRGVCKSQPEAGCSTDSHGELCARMLFFVYFHQDVTAYRLWGKYSLGRAIWKTGVLKRQTETQLHYQQALAAQRCGHRQNPRAYYFITQLQPNKNTSQNRNHNDEINTASKIRYRAL